MSTVTKILIVAGEASGDQHAARLVAAIKEELPRAEFLGVGGEALAAQGVRILWPASELAVVGLLEVAGRLPAVFRALKDIGRALKQERPQLVILVDFPDFNFWVARLAKYWRAPVMYYVSPQVWAWRTYRVRTIARLVDRMVVIFPFEAEFYRQRGVPAEYVGHPLVETLPPLPPRAALLQAWGLDPRRFTIALLPGSRASEIERHLPAMLEAAMLIKGAIPETQFVLPLASTAPREMVEEMVEKFGVGEGASPGLSLKIIDGQSYAALSAAHLAVVASGTATVEAALAATPTIIIYRLSPVTFAVGRLLVQVEHVGMANLLAGERLFPELLQHLFTPESLAREVLSLVRAPERLEAMRLGLARIVNRLGGPGASRRAAMIAKEIITGSSMAIGKN
ncbi:MAG: lipid-A-disaccharide synthase [Deltaproteobacteria bacterium]|nr:MAG: lipid-A-disaccharide synthase [Deltaproteobacteria bacterium]